MKQVNILGVNVNSMPISSILKSKKKNLFIATVNASFILKCQSNPRFKNILNNKTDINTIDSVSILMAISYLKKCRSYSQKHTSFVSKLIKPFVFICYGVSSGFDYNKRSGFVRSTGVSILRESLSTADRNSLSIVVFHRKDSHVSKKDIESYITTNYPNIYIDIKNIDIGHYDTLLSNRVRADYIFCTFGEYLQECFLSNNTKSFDCSILVGVGGAFDVLLGKVKINSKVSRLGLEWLFRLAYNPKRVVKIMRSVIVFPLRIYFYSLTRV